MKFLRSVFSYTLMQSRYEHELSRGSARFKEDFGDQPQDILYANLLRLHCENLIQIQKLEKNPRRKDKDNQQLENKKKENETLIKVLQYLEKSESTTFEKGEFYKLLESNKTARKYLLLFKDVLDPALQKQIFTHEVNKAYNRLQRHGSVKADIAFQIMSGKLIKKSEWNQLSQSFNGTETKTGRMLQYFGGMLKINPNTNGETLYDGNAPIKNELTVISQVQLSQQPPIAIKNDYKAKSVFAALDFYAIFRGLAASLFGKNSSQTSKKAANNYLKKWVTKSPIEEIKDGEAYKIVKGFEKGKHAEIQSLYKDEMEKDPQYAQLKKQYEGVVNAGLGNNNTRCRAEYH